MILANNQKFVRIPNSWYIVDDIYGSSFIGRLGDKRFILWFEIGSLSVEMNMSDTVPLQIKHIINHLKHIRGFNKLNNIRKMLLELKECGLIECEQISKDIKSNDVLYIKINTPKYMKELKNGFSTISIELYKDKLKKIQSKGFMIYCFLYKHHNIELGNQDCSNWGYAEARREYIGNILGIKSIKTVTEYTNKIVNAKSLVKKIAQTSYETTNEFGEVVTQYTTNRYIVWAKIDSGNKYYIGSSA